MNFPATYFGALMILSAFGGVTLAETPPTNAAAEVPPVSQSAADMSKDYLQKGTERLAAGDPDQAANDATGAIQLDPKNVAAYELRGSAYMEKKIWDFAERDYKKADEISPDPVYRYKLAEIKFRQKSYGDARSRFALLVKDPRLGDLATYNTFLCDLLGGHETLASQDLAAIDRAGKSPALFYSHAAWALFHHQRDEMAKYFQAARQVYDEATYDRYVASLLQAQRFQLNSATFTTKDGKAFQKVPVYLEIDGLRVSTAKGWVTLPIEQLPDDISSFPEEMRDQINKRRAVAPHEEATVSLITFTTKAGQSFDHVRWALHETALSVLSANGWISVPFDQLPSDLSAFPPDLQKSLEQKKKSATAHSVTETVVSFTTKQGKQYDQVRASLSRSEVRVLSADGWIGVPFDQLPADLSPFPSEWQTQIRSGHSSGNSAKSDTALVTFTTKKGKQYDQVRANLGQYGVRLLTDDGLIAVPFDQLPDDLTAFPKDWREQIVAGRKIMPKPAARPVR